MKNYLQSLWNRKSTQIFVNLANLFWVIFISLILFLSLRGIYGSPVASELTHNKWQTNGPFELSPERGRFGLLYSLVEDGSFHFSLDLARFIVPDLGYANGNYVSLFAPGVSFLAIPGYLIGKYFGAAQFGSFAVIAIISLINALLVRNISLRIGSGRWAASLAGITFLFATPAFAYAVNLYQHHLSGTSYTFINIFTDTVEQLSVFIGNLVSLCAINTG